MRTHRSMLQQTAVLAALCMALVVVSTFGLASEGAEPVITLSLGPGAVFSHAAFSPNGQRLAVACLNGMVKLYSTGTWNLVWEVTVFDTAEVSGVAFSPDGATIAASSPRILDVVVLRSSNGTEASRLTLSEEIHGDPEGKFSGIYHAVFSPDGTLLACTEVGYGSVKLVKARTGEELGTPIVHYGSGFDSVLAAFNPDGSQLASSDGEGAIIVIDVPTGEELKKAPRGKAYDIAFSPDGNLFSGSGSSVYLFDKDDWTMTRFAYATRTNYGVAVAVSPDGSLVASAHEHLLLWSTATGALLSSQHIQSMGYVWMRFSPNRNLLAAGLGKEASVEIWEVADLAGE